MRPRLLLILVASILVVAVASAGFAQRDANGRTQDRARASRIQQHVRLNYDMEICGGRWAFSPTSISVRWERETTYRRIDKAYLRAGARGTRCSGVGYTSGFQREFKPCFGCGNQSLYETRTYTFPMSEPYIMNSGESSGVGGNVRAVVVDRDDNVKSHLCTRVTLINQTDCDRATAASHVWRNRVSGHRVQQFLRVRYEFRNCYSGMFAIRHVAMRWHRTVRAREVGPAQVVVSADGGTCDERRIQRRIERRFNPCFGCRGARKHWTPWYRIDASVPYLGPATSLYDQLGVRLVGHVIDSEGDRLRLCSKIQFMENESCQG